MEAQQNQIQTQQDGGSSGKAVASNYLCRQSTTRWTPTTDQIKILKDLYYDKGIRSPTADQIQSISATLRKFGKIEGKNVFYWFQNHKARERQKKRFSTTAVNNTATNYTDQQLIPMQRASANIRYPNLISPGINCPPPSAAGMVSVGQMVGGCGYGHMSMESNIREYGMSASGNGGICAYPSQSFQWTGVNHYPQSYSFMESSRNPSIDYQVQFLDEDEEKSPGLETLPLFPIHAEDSSVSSFYGTMMRPEPENCYTSSCHWFNGADTVSTNLTSLELSLNLNSYGDQWQNY